MSVVDDFRRHVLHRSGKSADAVLDSGQPPRRPKVGDLHGSVVSINRFSSSVELSYFFFYETKDASSCMIVYMIGWWYDYLMAGFCGSMGWETEEKCLGGRGGGGGGNGKGIGGGGPQILIHIVSAYSCLLIYFFYTTTT